MLIIFVCVGGWIWITQTIKQTALICLLFTIVQEKCVVQSFKRLFF